MPNLIPVTEENYKLANAMVELIERHRGAPAQRERDDIVERLTRRNMELEEDLQDLKEQREADREIRGKMYDELQASLTRVYVLLVEEKYSEARALALSKGRPK